MNEDKHMRPETGNRSGRRWGHKLGLLIFYLLAMQISLAQDNRLKKTELTGYVKYLQTTTFYADTAQPATTNNLIHNRLNFRWYPAENWTVAIEARNRLFYGEEVKLARNIYGTSYGDVINQNTGLLNLSMLWLDESSVVLHSTLDRAYVNWSSKKWDVRVGRQRINWGINLAWTPNDLFNAFNFLDFDYEERPGSDAIRATYYPGLMSSAEVAFAPARDFSQSVGAAMYKFNVKGYDIQVLGGYARGDIVLGGGWAGNLGNAGFKGEATWFQPTTYSPDSTGALSLSVTVDYLLNNGLYVSGGALYNGLGESAGSGLQSGLTSASLSPKSLFPRKWATLLQASGQLNPLLSVNVSGIYSPTDNITVFFPSLSYSIRENWDIDLIGQTFFIDQPQGFGHAATAVYFRLKWSY